MIKFTYQKNKQEKTGCLNIQHRNLLKKKAKCYLKENQKMKRTTKIRNYKCEKNLNYNMN